MSYCEQVGIGSHPTEKHAAILRLVYAHIARVNDTFYEQHIERWPVNAAPIWQPAQFKENIHLKVGEFVVSETKVEFVDSQALTIILPTVGAPMAVRAEGDEVVILMRLTLRPRDNVVKIDLDVTASGNCATVPSLYKDAPFDISRYCGAVLHQEQD